MSGPVTPPDAPIEPAGAAPEPPTLQITAGRVATVGSLEVRRALPRRARRTVGAWCFVDHMGPATVDEVHGVEIGPHPHIGLQTVTWLLAGELLHRDSLGSEQLIRPGQLNLMTAGRGVAHAEERTGRPATELHGVQLWVAQPEATRDGPPAFEHHAVLPVVESPDVTATVLVGGFGGATSPAAGATDHLGVDLALRPGRSTLPLRPTAEHLLVALSGAVALEGRTVSPGHSAYLGQGRDELGISVTEPARALLLGGTPFGERPLMWWNFVAREREEIDRAWRSWTDEDGRFGAVDSQLPRVPVGPPTWRST